MISIILKDNSALRPGWLEGRRLRAWELKQQGWKQRDIADALGVSPAAVSQWMKRATEEGVESLRHRPGLGPRPRMTEAQWAQIPDLLARGAKRFGFPNNVWTIERLVYIIKREFDVIYHPAHVSRLLRARGIGIKPTRRPPRKGWVGRDHTLLRSPRRSSFSAKLKRKRFSCIRETPVNASHK